MLEDQSGSMPQAETGQDAQTDLQVADQNNSDISQEKVYSQKMRKRAQAAEAELEKFKARNKKIEEDSLVEQNKYKELWEKDKVDAEWARNYRKTKKASLLEKIPEDKRDNFKSWDLDQLETYIADVGASKSEPAETMKPVPGQVNMPELDKPWGEMNDQEKRAYYAQAAQAKGVKS